jgi:hypothetical protein
MVASLGCGGVVSFADTTEGHTGVIYKATNFSAVGVTANNYHYVSEAGTRLHKKQVWARAKQKEVTEAEQAASEGLKRVEELPKIRYFIDLTKIKAFKTNAATPHSVVR